VPERQRFRRAFAGRTHQLPAELELLKGGKRSEVADAAPGSFDDLRLGAAAVDERYHRTRSSIYKYRELPFIKKEHFRIVQVLDPQRRGQQGHLVKCNHRDPRSSWTRQGTLVSCLIVGRQRERLLRRAACRGVGYKHLEFISWCRSPRSAYF
jgi:hypothetical protein